MVVLILSVCLLTGYIFWSIFQALAPMIWFYPLNELEISGYEAFATVWLSPILCGIPGFLSLIRNRWCLGLLRLICVGSLASFQAPSTFLRLAILASGAGVSSLVLAATLFSPSQRIRWRCRLESWSCWMHLDWTETKYEHPYCFSVLFVQKPYCFVWAVQRSGAVWKSRWPSWAPVHNMPTVSVDVKQHSTNHMSGSTTLCIIMVDNIHTVKPHADIL